MWLTGHYVAPLVTRCFPIQPLPRESEDFARRDVPPLTYLIFLSPKELYVLDPFKCYGYLTMKYNASYEIFWTLFAIVYCASSSILYPFGHRALWSMADYGGNVLQSKGFHPTVIVKENLVVKRFDLSSPQANPIDSYFLYPFSYRTTQVYIKY